MIEFPPTLKRTKRGACVPAVIAVLHKLEDGRDVIIEGEVNFGRGWWHQHTWIERDGIIIDPTFDQYRRLKGYPHCQRHYVRQITVKEYRGVWRMKCSDWWLRRLAEFGVRAA